MAQIKRELTAWEVIHRAIADILNECKYEAKAKGIIELQYFGNVANLKKYAQRIVNSCERIEGEGNE